MFKSNKVPILTVALLYSVIGLTSCSNATKPTNADNSGSAQNSSNTSNTTTPADTTRTETTAKREKIGVPECDEYLEKYDACLAKLPEVERNAVINALASYRKTWRETASTPKGKSDLAIGCKEILEITRQTTRVYGCTW